MSKTHIAGFKTRLDALEDTTELNDRLEAIENSIADLLDKINDILERLDELEG